MLESSTFYQWLEFSPKLVVQSATGRRRLPTYMFALLKCRMPCFADCMQFGADFLQQSQTQSNSSSKLGGKVHFQYQEGSQVTKRAFLCLITAQLCHSELTYEKGAIQGHCIHNTLFAFKAKINGFFLDFLFQIEQSFWGYCTIAIFFNFLENCETPRSHKNELKTATHTLGCLKLCKHVIS